MHAPSPTSYNMPSRIIASPGKTFGKILPKPIPIGALGPGPAISQGEKPKNDNVAFTFGDRLQDIATAKQRYKPGPGTHDPEYSNGSPRIRIGTSARPQLGGDKETL